MFNISLMKRVSFLFLYLMLFQELLSDSLFTGIVLNSKTKQPEKKTARAKIGRTKQLEKKKS